MDSISRRRDSGTRILLRLTTRRLSCVACEEPSGEKESDSTPPSTKKCTLKSTRKIRASSPTNHRAVASLGQLYSRRVLGTVPGSKARRFLPVIITVRGQKWWDCRCRRKKPPLQWSRGHLPTEGEVSTNVQAKEAMVFVRFLIKTIAKEPAQRELKQQSGGFCAFPFK